MHLGGGLTGLRIVSLVFAVASVPLIALLGARLADRMTGVVAAALASGSWVMMFHGIYGRMYSLFLFTSLLSFLALLAALDGGGRRRFALWGAALLLMLASHPYAVLVVAAQGLFILLRRRRLREAIVTLAAVGVLGIPFWWADLVLRDRFDVGVGGGGPRLGSPTSVLHYFWWVAGDFSAGHHAWSTPVLLLALVGAVLLWRRRPRQPGPVRVRDRRARGRVHARDAELDSVTRGTPLDLRTAVLQRPARRTDRRARPSRWTSLRLLPRSSPSPCC